MERKTIRFNQYINGGYVVVSLKDGERFEHTVGGPNDEGYSYETTAWERNGDLVVCEVSESARDCDGRLDRESSYVWDGLTTIVNSHSGVAMPSWTIEESHQRDHEAERAGY